MEKAPDAFRTISEVSAWLDTPTHVLRFWESRFPDVAPVKRAGGRRYYRVEDMRLLGGIKKLLHEDGITIKALQDRIKSEGAESVAALSPTLEGLPDTDDPDGPSVAGDLAVEAHGAAEPAAGFRAPSRPPKSAGRSAAQQEGSVQGSLSLGRGASPDAADPSQASFKRHPGRKKRAETASAAKKPHPSRSGLFLYDDGHTPSTPGPDKAEAQSTCALAPIDGLPADPGDGCPAPHPVPAPAEMRALTALKNGKLPDAASECLSRLRSLQDRWT